VNKGRLIQWKGRNSLVVAVKTVEDRLVINYIEENGQNVYIHKIGASLTNS
jgi:hypothetical protein